MRPCSRRRSRRPWQSGCSPNSSGIPATGGVSLIADWAQQGPILENFAVSRSTGRADLNLDSALCFRSLETGEGLRRGEDWANYARVKFGTREIQTTGRLHGKPVIIIHGRRDALVFPNLQSRAYYALNQQHERKKSRLSYIEVTTGQHFDAFISSSFASPTSGAQFAPLHYYFVKAMDSMYAHLTAGAALPPSQVVRPTPHGLAAYSSRTCRPCCRCARSRQPPATASPSNTRCCRFPSRRADSRAAWRDFATSSAPIMPLAPGRSSTMTCCPGEGRGGAASGAGTASNRLEEGARARGEKRARHGFAGHESARALSMIARSCEGSFRPSAA